MRVLITGALGFTGRHLTRRLGGEPDVYLCAVDRPAFAPGDLPFAEYHSRDLAAEGALRTLVEKLRPDWVFHLSGLFSGSAPALYRANLMTVVELLEAVVEHAPAAKVLVVGSAAEYGLVKRDRLPITEEMPCAPISPYGRAKYAATEAALDYARQGLKVSVVRPFNIVGAGVPTSLVVGAVLDRIARALELGEQDVPVGNLECERDFVAIDDVVEGYTRLMTHDVWGEVFNVCSGRPTTIRSVVTTLLSYAPRPLRAVVDPALCRPDDAPVVYGSWERAHQAFGFAPATPLEGSLWAAWHNRMGESGR